MSEPRPLIGEAPASDVSRFWKYVSKISDAECWEWTGSLTHNGYGSIWFMGYTCRAHRVSYLIHCGPVPDGMCVLHRCDNRKCCNPSHLYLGDWNENMQDMKAKGRAKHPKGEEHQFAKLTEDAVIEIRTLLAAGKTDVEVGAQFGISKSHASQIGRGIKWKHVGGPIGRRQQRVSDEQKKEALKLYFGEKLSQVDICRKLGLSRPWLCTFLKSVPSGKAIATA